MQRPFADLRTITGAADSLAAGLDPLVQNPGDPWGRAMTYPRVWLALAHLGITQIDTVIIAFVEIALFVWGLWALGRLSTSRLMGSILLLHVFSPVTALAVERANNDLVAFVLVSVFCLSIGSSDVRRRVGASTALVLAIVLKLFPLFALPALLVLPRRRALHYAGTILLVSVAYFVVTLDALLIIFRDTPRADFFSYGMNVVWPRLGIGYVHTAAFAALAVVVAGALWLSRRATTTLSIGPTDAAFLAGAGIYTCTFVLGNNCDYRLVFLILTVPKLVEWTQSRPDNLLRSLAWIAIGASLLSCWHLALSNALRPLPHGYEGAYFVDEATNWALFAALLTLLLKYLRGRWSVAHSPEALGLPSLPAQ